MQRIMIKNVKVLVLALLLAAASCSFTTSDEDPGKDKVLVSLISYVLEKDIMMQKNSMMLFLKKYLMIL